MTLQLLTMTGARPIAFDLCQRWMWNQDYNGPVHWIVVDDGEKPSPIYAPLQWQLTVVRPEPFWQPGDNTQGRNILAGLEHVDRKSPLAIIEDDDWYGPGWLTQCAKLMEDRDLGGEGNNRYYHVPARRWHQFTNAPKKASLCSTVMKGKPIDHLIDIIHKKKGNPRFFDITLWNECGDETNRAESTRHTVGTKGLPGRPGIGCGHDAKGLGNFDEDGSTLVSWVGAEDAAALFGAVKGA